MQDELCTVNAEMDFQSELMAKAEATASQVGQREKRGRKTDRRDRQRERQRGRERTRKRERESHHSQMGQKERVRSERVPQHLRWACPAIEIVSS